MHWGSKLSSDKGPLVLNFCARALPPELLRGAHTLRPAGTMMGNDHMKPHNTHPLSGALPKAEPQRRSAEAKAAGVIPSEFRGPKPGYQFRMKGTCGMGYYPLVAPAEELEPPQPAPAAVAPPDELFSPEATFVAAEAFCGFRPGFVFKAGEEGLGYYRCPLAPTELAAPVEKPPNPLDELHAAGGDVQQLAMMSKYADRSMLTGALKELGFKGLRTRQKIEKALEELHSRPSPS